jgi:hypothetical protein
VTDWIESLGADVSAERARAEARRLESERQQSEARVAALRFLEVLDRSCETAAAAVNARIFGGERTLRHGYVNHIITGDQFQLKLYNFTMEVRLEGSGVAYTTRTFISDNGGSYVPTPQGSGRIAQDTNPEEGARVLISTLVRLAEAARS